VKVGKLGKRPVEEGDVSGARKKQIMVREIKNGQEK